MRQGQFDKVTQFEMQPVERAAYFARLGAKKLHIVDLDGAKTGSMQQLSLICTMQNAGVTVQAGGGIRSLEQAELCFASGISNLVIGSIAITDPELTADIIQRINPQHIILAIDVRLQHKIPVPAIHGWQTTTENNLWDVVSHYQQLGVRQVLCTDIACDGMMQGPNFQIYKEAVERFPQIGWQASGGIRDTEDIKHLEGLGVNAAILGLTLYQGTFDLRSLLSEVEGR